MIKTKKTIGGIVPENLSNAFKNICVTTIAYESTFHYAMIASNNRAWEMVGNLPLPFNAMYSNIQQMLKAILGFETFAFLDKIIKVNLLDKEGFTKSNDEPLKGVSNTRMDDNFREFLFEINMKGMFNPMASDIAMDIYDQRNLNLSDGIKKIINLAKLEWIETQINPEKSFISHVTFLPGNNEDERNANQRNSDIISNAMHILANYNRITDIMDVKTVPAVKYL